MRVCLGVFFIFEGIAKLGWFTDPSILAATFQRWLTAPTTPAASRWYLEQIAIPGVRAFAWLVPLGELLSGVALVIGFHTGLFGFVALSMALNFHFASGAMFARAFLTNGYGLPELAPTLALAGRPSPLVFARVATQ